MYLEWRQLAACKGEPEIFFSDDEQSLARARSICEGCEVRADCLEAALAAGPNLHGLWGGLTQAERRRPVVAASLALDLSTTVFDALKRHPAQRWPRPDSECRRY